MALLPTSSSDLRARPPSAWPSFLAEGARVPAAVRVLVAIDPFMYGEVLAFSLSKRRPRAEVTLLASSEDLAAEAQRARPHLVVADRVPPAAKARSLWVEVAVLRG